MDPLQTVQSLGIQLPGPGYIFGVIVFSLVGIAAWRFGRKRGRRLTQWLGVALMFYPYLVSGTGLLYAVGLALCAGIWFDRDGG